MSDISGLSFAASRRTETSLLAGLNLANCEKGATVSTRRASIAQVMFVVALAAANLALIRELPVGVSAYPTVWMISGVINFLVVWRLILNRGLRAFHYTFTIVFVIVSIVAINLVASERVHPLGFLVRWYQELSGGNTISIAQGHLWIGEFWVACFLSFTLALAVGLLAGRLERGRGWDIAAFWRGVLAGFGVAALVLELADATVWHRAEPSSAQLITRLAILGACVVAGGVTGLRWLRSKSPLEKSLDHPS